MSNLFPTKARLLLTLRALGAVVGMSIRAAVRSRVVAALLVLLAASVIGIPLLVTGDGTPASELQVRLQYTLACCLGMLGLATLWAACASFGVEIDSRRMELTAITPVHPLTLWFGRWLGILLLDALLLLAVVAGVRLQLGRMLGHLPGSADSASLLVSRARVSPNLPEPEQEARRHFEELRRSQRLPADINPAEVFRRLVFESRNRYTVINPGERASWQFHLPQPVPADGKLWIRMRFDTAAESLASVRGVWRMRRPGEGTWALEVPVNDVVRNELELSVAAVCLAGAQELDVEFAYPAAGENAALLIQPRRNLAVLMTQGTFTGNLLRVMAAQLAILAALAALGLTLGACFSFPVAAFVATASLLAVLVTAGNVPDVQQLVAPGEQPGFMDRVAYAVSRSVDQATKPLLQPEPLAHAVAGERVPGSDLWRMLFWGGLVYPLWLAWVAGWALRRREMARQ
ncbi:MAG: hypothetical protein WCR06_07800 [bacterium]